jgi:anti-sigma B factor antagonist
MGVDDQTMSMSHRLEAGRVVVTLAGEIDAASTPALDGALVALRPLVGRLQFDLSDVTFMDSAGLRSLLRAWQICVEDLGQSAWISSSSSWVDAMLRLTGLTDHFAE